jgi:hypothetical protein
MALVKTIPDPDGPGTIDSYAKYSSFAIDTDLRTVTLRVSVYRSQAARDAVDGVGNPLYRPVLLETYQTDAAGTTGPGGTIPGAPTYAQYTSGDNANPSGVGAQIYGFLKAFTGWAGATDA